MKIAVITSFSEEYYNRIGKDCVKTWLQYWPTELTLTCYVEGFSLPATDRIEQISFDRITDYQTFVSGDTGKVKGQVQKFAKKAFSFVDAMYNIDADWIVWVDADVISVDNLPMELLKSVLPDDVLSTHMGVTYTTKKDGTPGRWFVPETGFFAVNTNHNLFSEFRKEYKRHYLEYDNSMMRRFFDNDVYGHVFEKLNAPGYDLCKDFKKPYKTPIKHTVLGPYLEHYKAKGAKAQWANED